MKLQDMDWQLVNNKKYPISKSIILVYGKVPNDIFDSSKGYFEEINEVHYSVINKQKRWKTPFFELNEKWIIAWTYFDYPNL
jgi:hypothetical protein